MRTIQMTTFPGMVADPRNTSGSQLCKHFDNFSQTHALIPYKDSEDAYISQSTIKLQNFLMYLGTMYALGVVTGQAQANILSNAGIDVPSWVSPTNGSDSSGTTDFNLFIEYLGVLYGASSGSRIWSYDIAGTTFTATTGGGGIAYSSIRQGLVKAKKLYIPIDNKIYYKDGANNIALGLTLPTNLVIESICEYGNYIAIACRGLSLGTNSYVFLWDRDVTLVDPNERIDWGNKALYLIESIDGYIVGVSSINGLNSSSPSKVIFSRYSGSQNDIVFNEISMTFSSSTPIKRKQKYNNRMHFGLTGTSIGGTTNDFTGLWSVGKNSDTAPFTVIFSQLPNNDTVATGVQGFIIVNDYFYISYLDGSGNFGLSKTNDQVSYTATSVFRSSINPGNMPEGDKFDDKQLIGVCLVYDAIPTSGQVVLKYKVDGGSFTTVFTDTTVGSTFSEFPNAAGVNFTDGDELEYQIESKGVKITGLIYKYESIPTLTS